MAIKIVDMEYVEIDGKIVGALNAAFATILSGGESSEYISIVNSTAELQKELVAWAANLRATYQKQADDSVNHAKSQIEAIRIKMAQASDNLKASEIARDFHQKRGDLAIQLAEHCVSGISESAVAAARELKRIELAGKAALIDAEKAAIAAM